MSDTQDIPAHTVVHSIWRMQRSHAAIRHGDRGDWYVEWLTPYRVEGPFEAVQHVETLLTWLGYTPTDIGRKSDLF